MKVTINDRFVITEHPNPKVGTQCFEKYCNIQNWQKCQFVFEGAGITPEYAFMTEGGGFVINGNQRADAIIAHTL